VVNPNTVKVGAADKGAAIEGAKVPEQAPMTSQASCHAPQYTVENGSNLQSLSRLGIAAVDLHLKICPFIDTKLPAT
jgi:hypothetical protein